MRYALALVTVAASVLFLALNTNSGATAQARVSTDDLPDLVVTDMRTKYEVVEWCKGLGTPLGTTVYVQNVGVSDAGPFFVAFNEWQQTVDSGLPAGEETSLWFAYPEGYNPPNLHGIVDATFLVTESDENNNEADWILPTPTAPPTCTPAPAPTATATPLRADPVGGVAEPPGASQPDDGRSNTRPIAFAGLAAAIALAAGVLFARRRARRA